MPSSGRLSLSVLGAIDLKSLSAAAGEEELAARRKLESPAIVAATRQHRLPGLVGAPQSEALVAVHHCECTAAGAELERARLRAQVELRE